MLRTIGGEVVRDSSLAIPPGGRGVCPRIVIDPDLYTLISVTFFSHRQILFSSELSNSSSIGFFDEVLLDFRRILKWFACTIQGLGDFNLVILRLA